MSRSIQDFLDSLPRSKGALAKAAQKNKVKRIKKCNVKFNANGSFSSMEAYYDDEPPIEAYYDDELPIEAYCDDEPPIEAYYDDEPSMEAYYDDELAGFDEVEHSPQDAGLEDVQIAQQAVLGLFRTGEVTEYLNFILKLGGCQPLTAGKANMLPSQRMVTPFYTPRTHACGDTVDPLVTLVEETLMFGPDAVSLLPKIPLDHATHPELMRWFIACAQVAGLPSNHWTVKAGSLLPRLPIV